MNVLSEMDSNPHFDIAFKLSTKASGNMRTAFYKGKNAQLYFCIFFPIVSTVLEQSKDPHVPPCCTMFGKLALFLTKSNTFYFPLGLGSGECCTYDIAIFML